MPTNDVYEVVLGKKLSLENTEARKSQLCTQYKWDGWDGLIRFCPTLVEVNGSSEELQVLAQVVGWHTSKVHPDDPSEHIYIYTYYMIFEIYKPSQILTIYQNRFHRCLDRINHPKGILEGFNHALNTWW